MKKAQKTKVNLFITIMAFCAFFISSAQADHHVPFEDTLDVPKEPTEYRTKAYRSPVPNSLKGASVLTNEEVMTLWKEKSAIFIDVMPRVPKPKGLPKGTIWRDKRRDNIPGSFWLVNVGYGILSKPSETYFKTNLNKITKGDKTKPIVIYCKANCWMSWNAAKRAVEWGYSKVNWYPQGTDGWKEVGGKLEERVSPVPAAEGS